MVDLDPPKVQQWNLGAGIKVQMQPLVPGLFEQVQAELSALTRRALAGDAVINGIDMDAFAIPSPDTEEGRAALANLFYYICLAQVGITKWEGVNAALTPGNIAILLLSKDWAYQKFRQEYSSAYGELISEGNGSGSSLNTDIATAQNTATIVPKSDPLAPKATEDLRENIVPKSNTD